MSIAFLIRSESQLSQGLPWVKRLGFDAGRQLQVIVLGKDRNTLAQHAVQAFQKNGMKVAIEQLEPNPSEVVRFLRSMICKRVLVIDDGDESTFDSSFFGISPFETLWLRPNGTPPSEGSAFFSLQADLSSFDRQSCQKFLGAAPTLNLVDTLAVSDNDDIDGCLETVVAAERQRCDPGDVVWIGIDSKTETVRRLASLALLAKSKNASIIVYRDGETMAGSFLSRVRHWATHVAEPMGREQRIELATSLTEGSRPNLEFLGLISASAMLAAFGLLQNSAAVIIGAMLVAPLMTPILGAGLALTHGNRPMFRSSIATILLGFVGALISSFLFGCLVQFIQPPEVTAEMWARCQPSPLDFCVGLVGGMAASYARTRSHLSSALAGAAIAAALVPPISTAGLQLSFGVFEKGPNQGIPVLGPLLLVTVNVLTIMIGSSFVLFARGMRIDERRFSASDRWTTRMTVLLVTLVMLVLVWVLHPSIIFGDPAL